MHQPLRVADSVTNNCHAIILAGHPSFIAPTLIDHCLGASSTAMASSSPLGLNAVTLALLPLRTPDGDSRLGAPKPQCTSFGRRHGSMGCRCSIERSFRLRLSRSRSSPATEGRDTLTRPGVPRKLSQPLPNPAGRHVRIPALQTVEGIHRIDASEHASATAWSCSTFNDAESQRVVP